MKELSRCSQCGEPLSSDAPQGLCPACLLKLAAQEHTDALDPSALREADPSLDVPAESSPPANAENLAALFPQLEILEPIGAGGMGVVFKARQKQLDRIVALKLMHPRFSRDPQFAERFNREARALGKLSHPSIVHVYEFGTVGGAGDRDEQYYFIMEYVDGANLQQMIGTKSLSAQQALAIVPKLCDALQYAHDEGVVHRDIKPANILVDKKGRVKIADFGLAKIAGLEDGRLTRTNQGMGTMMYMAPEQMENAKSVDHRADIYSLGVVFYEMLTGELPMGRFANPSQTPGVDVRFDEIVLHAMERDVNRRYQHASEVKTDVESVTGPAVFEAENPAPVQSGAPNVIKVSLGKTPGRNIRLVIPGAAAILGILLIVVTLVFMKSGSAASTGMAGVESFCTLLTGAGILISLLILIAAVVSVFQEWRTDRFPFVWLVIRTALWLVYALCFVSFFGANTTTSGKGTLFNIGTPFPWFVCDTGESFHMNLLLSSWAWAIFAAGWLCLFALRKSEKLDRNLIAAIESNPSPKTAAATPFLGIPAVLIASCILGIAGCLWPVSLVEHSFFSSSDTRDHKPGDKSYVHGDYVLSLDESSPAATVGVIAQDTLVRMGGQATEKGGLEPDRIWKQTPVGANLKIELYRGNDYIFLNAVRFPDPAIASYYMLWQGIAGFSFLLLALFVFLGPTFPSTLRWRGVSAALVGLGLLMVLLLISPSDRLHLLWGHFYSSNDAEQVQFWQKLLASAAALAVLLLGVFDIRRAFGQTSAAA